MPSLLKSQTARINGAKSRGPITPEGKARSSANSRRHGFTSRSILLVGESARNFRRLRTDFMDQFQPQSGVEANLVQVMAIASWRLRRLLGIETHLFDLELTTREEQIDDQFEDVSRNDRLAFVFQKLADSGNALPQLIRYEAALNRSYDRAFKQLLLLQSTRPPAPPLGSFRIFEFEPVPGIENGD